MRTQQLRRKLATSRPIKMAVSAYVIQAGSCSRPSDNEGTLCATASAGALAGHLPEQPGHPVTHTLQSWS